jgi:hypothetical protein
MGKIPQLSKAELKKAFLSLGDVAQTDAAICSALRLTGHVDTIVLELMRVGLERRHVIEQALQDYGITDHAAAMSSLEQHYYEQLFAPQLQQIMQEHGPLGIISLYRQLVREKAHDGVAPWGMRLSTSITKVKEFCAQRKIDITTHVKELATREVNLIIAAAHKTPNPVLHLRKIAALLKIAEQEGRDTELDGNAGIKLQLMAIEQALRKFPAN